MTTGAVNPRRADTRRSHERILAAALEALTTSGEVSFNAIAKRAGVGVGTVYRHFPTPGALVLAAALRTATPYREELHETIASAVSALLEANVRAGSVRADLNPETVLRGLSGVLHLNPRGDWPSQTEDLTDLLWKGMRADQDE